MLPGNITSDDIDGARRCWKKSGEERRYYLQWMSAYQSSPFPYRWDCSTKSSIIPPNESMAVRGRCVDWVPLLPSSFKSRFYKTLLRRVILKGLMLVERNVGSSFSEIYRKWFNKISNRDKRWSFLECLEGLEMNNFWLGF